MKVAIVIFDGVQALDVAGPLDVFAEANTLLTQQQKYEVSLVGPRAGTVTCSNGMGLSVPYRYADLDTQWDLLLIAGGPQLPDVQLSNDFLTWLQNQAQHATRFGSIFNGAFVLAMQDCSTAGKSRLTGRTRVAWPKNFRTCVCSRIRFSFATDASLHRRA